MKRLRKIGCIALLVFVGLSVMLGIAMYLTQTASSTATPLPSASDNRPMPAIAKANQPTFNDRIIQEAHDAHVITADGSITNIVPGDKTAVLIDMGGYATADLIKLNCFDMQVKLWQAEESHLSEVDVIFNAAMTDSTGHTSSMPIASCFLTKKTEQTLRWDGLDKNSAWSIYDHAYIDRSIK